MRKNIVAFVTCWQFSYSRSDAVGRFSSADWLTDWLSGVEAPAEFDFKCWHNSGPVLINAHSRVFIKHFIFGVLKNTANQLNHILKQAH